MNNQNMNNITACTNESHEISINITGKAFVGLARQGMLCHQGVSEECDDALAAALAGEKARICVALAPDADKNYIHLAVADWGCGMDLAALTNALQLGSAPLTNSRLNEHGYGLNNALACLSGGTGDWCWRREITTIFCREYLTNFCRRTPEPVE